MKNYFRKMFILVLLAVLILGFTASYSPGLARDAINSYSKGNKVPVSELLKSQNSFQTNPDWYKLENQPADAIKTVSTQVAQTIQKSVSVFIGKKIAIVDGVTTTLDAPPQIIPPGRTFVPVRFIAENLGYSVNWNAKERKVTLQTEGKTIELWINKKKATVNGEEVELDSAPFIDPKYNRTYLPFRWLAEQLGATVSWNPSDPMGKKASFSLSKTTYVTVQKKEINLQSDADNDDLTFAEEKEYGLNPNNSNTISKFVNDGSVVKWADKYDVNLQNYNPKNGLSIEANVLLGFNPNTPFNITTSITDRQALELYKSLGHDDFTSVKDVFSTLHDFTDALINKNFNEKYGTLNYERTIVAGVLEAVKLGYVKSDKDSISSMVNEINKELFDMLDNRAFKKGETLDDFVAYFIASHPDSPRILSLVALNSVFGNNPINLLLSESPSIQQAVKEKTLNKYSDLIEKMQVVANSEDASLNKKIEQTNTFKENIDQYSLYKFNTAELLVRLWNSNDQIHNFMKTHPKTSLAIVSGYSNLILEQGKVTYQGKDYNFDSKEVMDELQKIISKLFLYYGNTEKEFNEKQFGFARSEDHKGGLESFSVNDLVGLVPVTVVDSNYYFKKVLAKQGVIAAVDLFDMADELQKVKEALYKYQWKKVQLSYQKSIYINPFFPEIGTESVRMLVSPYPVNPFNEDEINDYVAKNSILKRDPHFTVHLGDRSTKTLVDKVVNALNNGWQPSYKGIYARQLEIAGVRQIMDNALLYPIHVTIWPWKEDLHGCAASENMRADENSKKLAKKFLTNTNFKLAEKLLPKGEWSSANIKAILLWGITSNEVKYVNTFKKNEYDVKPIRWFSPVRSPSEGLINGKDFLPWDHLNFSKEGFSWTASVYDNSLVGIVAQS